MMEQTVLQGQVILNVSQIVAQTRSLYPSLGNIQL